MIVPEFGSKVECQASRKKSLMIIGFETDNLGHRMNFENVEVVSLVGIILYKM